MTTAKFSSTVDDALMRELDAASELAGLSRPKVKTGPKTHAIPEGYKALINVFPVSSVPHNLAVRVFEPDFWAEPVRKFIPKVDPKYIYHPDALLAGIYAIMQGKVILFHGPKGSGKTTLVQQICARLGMPFIRVNCREDMDSSALFGSVSYDPVNGVSFKEGPVAELGRHGGVLCIDEVSRMPAGIAASMMGVMESPPTIYLSDKPGSSADKFISPHPWFRIATTDNTELQGDTTGKYVGTNVQDEALIDRINVSFRLGYLSPSHEVAIITGKVTSIDTHTATSMVQLANMVRSSYDQGAVGFTMSPRGLLEWAEGIEFWGDIVLAFKYSFFNKLTAPDAAVVAEFYHTVFAENIR